MCVRLACRGDDVAWHDRPMEERLSGGVDHAGRVVRVGATVRRPATANRAAIRSLLGHLEALGFAGAPRFLGTDEQGRDVLEYIPGDVAVEPYPDWVADDDLLVSVAALQRALHAAAAGFRLPPDEMWAERALPAGADGLLVCHLDLCLENVVVRDGRAAAFIDFDLAGPADPLYDIAIAARHWIPLRDPADVADARRDADPLARFARFADAHGLDRNGRERTVGLLLPFLDLALVSMRARAASGHPGFAAIWNGGYAAMNRRSRDWLERSRARLAAG